MSHLILHHYPGSPFSEKVRLVFGFKGLAWKSVTVPVMLPKPDVIALTGGYRRTPFLQIGADIYCDSALMCRVIDRLAPQPSLYPASAGGAASIVAQWADSALFWIAVPYTMQPAGVQHIFAGAPPEFLTAFRSDRAAMTTGIRRATLADGGAALLTYLDWLEQQLADGRRFLCGEAASIADFSVAQSVWYLRRAPPVATVLGPFVRVGAWYERVHAFGRGQPEQIGSDDALTIAAAAKVTAPTSVDADQGFAPGVAVTVSATDYAQDAVAGTLCGLTRDEVAVARADPRAGRVVVHFPRIGFQVKKEEATA